MQKTPVAIITGGASGIGRALAEEQARRGFEVIVADRQATLAEEVAAGIDKRRGRAVAAELDVRDAAAFQKLADATIERTGRIDQLFNNAGIAVARAGIENYEVRDWDDVIDVNLNGVAYGIQAVYPQMVRQGFGHIINTASVAGLVPATEGSYTATKHAVVGLSKVMRIEAAQHGVRVSVLCPGAIRTPILTGGHFGRVDLPGVTQERMLQIWEKFRPIDPDELAVRALAAIERNEAIIVVPRWWKAFWYLDRLSPTLSLALWRKMHGGLMKELERAGSEAEAPSAASRREASTAQDAN